MNSFIYNETSESRDPVNRRRVYLTNDGKVDVTFNKPEWRDGLEYLRKLYAEGLLASESFTLKMADLRGLVEYDQALIVGSLPGGGPHNFANTQGERRKDFEVLLPLKGPKGVQQIWWDEYAGPRPGRYIVTKDCKIPDIALKWVDYCYTPDFSSRSRYGILGRDWIKPPDGTKAVNGEQAQYEEVLKWGTPQKAYWGPNVVTGIRFPSYYRALSPDPYELEFVLWNALQAYRPYAFKKSVPKNLAFTLEESRQYAELNRLIIEYVEQSLAGFVTGRLDLNTGWNKYLSDLDAMGLSNLIKITQAGFDRSWKEALGY
jgi:putative aldouronate transport system substrate-binding protein